MLYYKIDPEVCPAFGGIDFGVSRSAEAERRRRPDPPDRKVQAGRQVPPSAGLHEEAIRKDSLLFFALW